MLRYNAYLGLAFEDIFGEDDSNEAEVYLKHTSCSLNGEAGAQIVGRPTVSRGITFTKPGHYSTTGDISYLFDAVTLPYVLKAAMGNYEYADGKHVLTTSESTNLPSLVVYEGIESENGMQHLKWVGQKVESIEISQEMEFAELTMSMIGSKDLVSEAKTDEEIEAGDVGSLPYSPIEVKVKIDGEETDYVNKNLSISLANGLDQDSGKFLGNRFLQKIRAGEREIGLNLGQSFVDLAMKKKLWGSSSGVSEGGSDTFKLEIIYENSDGEVVSFVFPKVYIDQLDIERGGQDEVGQELTLNAVVDNYSVGELDIKSDMIVVIDNAEGSIE